MRFRVLVVLLFPLLGFASEQWTEVKSPHFTVVTDGGEKRGRDVALRFEQMRQVFGSLVLRGEVKTSRPVQILAFRNTKGIRQMAPIFKGKPVEVAGLYQKGQSQDYIALDLSAEGDYRWQTVFHEYAHLLLNSNTMEWPVWFDEGFAEFFSTIDLSGKQALIGRAPESAAQMIVNSRLIPVAQIFSVQHDSATYNESGDHRNMFYAESWLIVHYLYDKQLVRQAITSFAVSKGRPDEAEFRKNVGMGFSDFDKALQQYIRGNRLIGWNTALPSGIDANSFSARSIAANDALVAAAEMHANSLDHEQEGIRELEQAVSADPANGKAQSDLGYAYLRKGDYAHAETYLEKAASSGSNDAMIHYYYYAMLLQQKFQGGVPSDQQLARQKTELEQAIALNPSLAEGYNLLSYNARLRGDSPAAIDAALRAVALDQRNENYALNLANIYLSAQKIPEAQSVIDRLRSSESTQTLTAIASMQSYISQWQNYRLAAEAYKKQDGAGSENAEESKAQKVSPSVTLRLADERSKSPRQILEGTLVQVNCSSSGPGTLFIQKGARLIQLRFRSFSNIVDPDSGDLSCATRERRVVAESTIDGTVQRLSLAK